jgi:hypothetical protein
MDQGVSASVQGASSAVCLQVAGLGILVRSGQDGLSFRVGGPSRKFLVPPGDGSAVALEASWGDLTGGQPARLIFDSGGAWRLYEEPDGQYGFRFYSSNTGDSPYLLMRLTKDARSGTLVYHRPFYPEGAPIDPLQFPADEVLMIHLLGQGLGAELHACGVVDENGAGYLFAGQSGDGKTTTARLWQGRHGVRILSDDRIVVRRRGDEFLMFGTPWHGEAELAECAEAPIRAIFFLERGLTNRFVHVSPSNAAAQLMARSFVPFHDSASLERTLGFMGQLSSHVPCARLPFVPDGDVCGFVATFGQADSSAVAPG